MPVCAGKNISNELVLQLSAFSLCVTSPRCCLHPSSLTWISPDGGWWWDYFFFWPELPDWQLGEVCLSLAVAVGSQSPVAVGLQGSAALPGVLSSLQSGLGSRTCIPAQCLARGWQTTCSDCGECKQLGRVSMRFPCLSLPSSLKWAPGPGQTSGSSFLAWDIHIISFLCNLAYTMEQWLSPTHMHSCAQTGFSE